MFDGDKMETVFVDKNTLFIEKENINCVYAVEQGLGEIITNFRNIPDEYISERANDIEDIKNRIEELSELFDLKEFINQPVRKLSLGQRMRAEIATSLMHRPKIIFLDEPTIGLDVVSKKKLRELRSVTLRSLKRSIVNDNYF